MRAYAGGHGHDASLGNHRDAATGGVANKPAKETAAAYSELLTALRILDPLEAWLPTRKPLLEADRSAQTPPRRPGRSPPGSCHARNAT